MTFYPGYDFLDKSTPLVIPHIKKQFKILEAYNIG